MDTGCVDSSDKGRVVAPCLKPRLDYTVLTSKDSSRRTRECASTDGSGLVAKSCDSCNPIACQAPLPWDSPGKNTGMGCHFLLQGIFPIQGSNSGLPLCRQILYCLSHWGSQDQARILERVAISFSMGSSQPRNPTQVSCNVPALLGAKNYIYS